MTDPIDNVLADIFASPLVATGLTLLGIVMVALWLAAAWWAYQDAARRSESTLVAFVAAAWIIVSTPLLLPAALAVYAFARPQITAAEHRARYLVRELSAVAVGPACPTCRMPVDSSWVRCPACAVWLAAPCRSCGAWSARDLEACPYCGSEEHDAPVVVPDLVPGTPVRPGIAVGPSIPAVTGPPAGVFVRARAAGRRPAGRGAGHPAGQGAGHGMAAAGVSPAAAAVMETQRVRVASSARPFSYATSRDASSISS